MEKLKEVISQYSRWSALSVYIERIESSKDSDFSLAFENIKSLLESIGKEICNFYAMPLEKDANMGKVIREAFSALKYSKDGYITQISQALGRIGQNIGDLRNEIGATGHGRTIAEIRERNEKVDVMARDFLIDSVRTISIFLIRAFEERLIQNVARLQESEPEQIYDNFKGFNDLWDELYGEFAMGEYSYPASQILYSVDPEVYHYERKNFETSPQDNSNLGDE
jgi:hypothetical protein